MLFYQPIARYWEQGGAEARLAAEAACRQIAQLRGRLGQQRTAPDLDRPAELEILPAPPPNLLEEVHQLLGKGAYSALPLLFPELLDYHRQWCERVECFAAAYPHYQDLLEALRADLGEYQNAVGALVEEAWEDGATMLAEVAQNLALREAAMERVRRQDGFSPIAELDQLAWSLQRGNPQGQAVRKKLEAAEAEVSLLLEREFPDPRLSSEWADLWRPLGRELNSRLAEGAELALLPRLEEFFQGHAHWLQRARQRRDFRPLDWWRQLREDLTGWFAGWKLRDSVQLEPARVWLNRGAAEWPKADRDLRLMYLEKGRQWLIRIEGCLASSARQQVAGLVAFGDLQFDRWLWLESKA